MIFNNICCNYTKIEHQISPRFDVRHVLNLRRGEFLQLQIMDNARHVWHVYGIHPRLACSPLPPTSVTAVDEEVLGAFKHKLPNLRMTNTHTYI